MPRPKGKFVKSIEREPLARIPWGICVIINDWHESGIPVSIIASTT